MTVRSPSKGYRAAFLSAASVLTLMASAATTSALAEGDGSKPVTWEDILNDEKTTNDVVNWGMGVRNHRYSSLEKINLENISRMRPA